MKLILVILVILAHFALSHCQLESKGLLSSSSCCPNLIKKSHNGKLDSIRSKRSSSIILSCPQRCLTRRNYCAKVKILESTVMDMLRTWVESDGFSFSLPHVEAYQVDEACQDALSAQTCVSGCTDPDQGEEKRKIETLMSTTANLACDLDIKVNYPCLVSVFHNVSSSGLFMEKCPQYTEPVAMVFNQSRFITVENVKIVSMNLCQFVKCALETLKNSISQNCQEVGYSAASTVFKKLAKFAEAMFALYHPPLILPDECKLENTVDY